ncbi:serine hydrolase [Bacteroidota bacterium]
MRTLSHTITCFLAILIMIQTSCTKREDPVIIHETDPVTDIEGNVYKTILIGNQQWMVENLNVSHFRNGDPIPEARTKEEWELAGMEGRPAWCYYNNEASIASKYGKLYNWYAVGDPRGLSPAEWRVATTKAWADLINYLGGDDIAGLNLKSDTGWDSNGNGDNLSGFTGLPGGGRVPGGDFLDMGRAGAWWADSEHSGITSYGYNLNNSTNSIFRGVFDKATGLSVRAVHCLTCTDDTTQALTFSEKLQKALDAAQENGTGKGISAAVILPDGETWIGVSGISHRTTLISPEMLFSIGSVQKMFVGAAILQLEEAGEISLEDSLYKWLPSYDFVDSTITIRQLLNHTSGLYNFVDCKEYWDAVLNDPGRIWSMEETFLAYNRESHFSKGTDWHYSQTGYNMLRMIIRDITGSDISTVNNERFWSLLTLTGSFTSEAGELPEKFAHGWYDLDGNGSYEDFSSFQRTAFVSSIGGETWSTAEDLAKWVRALLHDKTVVSQASLDKMLTFHSPCTGEEFICAGYGLSVIKFKPELLNGILAIGHGGNAPGYAAGCFYLPDYGVSIGICENTEEGEIIGNATNDLVKVIIPHIENN